LEKSWRYLEADPAIVARLRSDVIDRADVPHLLALRGINDFDSAKDFFRPDLSRLHDPLLMLDMPKAVDRVMRALGNGERILVYGDYDVDGTTAVAMMYSYLRELGQVDYYIPDRYKEGYGISLQGMEHAAQHGYSLVIALDCGIRGNEAIAHANSLGVDVIVCDHHLPGPVLPPAYAILDPKREGCPYPYKELCGCGVGFKLIQAIHQASGESPDTIYRYLDLAAISIGADIVPITGENRILAYHGLQLINTRPSIAIRALLEGANIRKALTISDVVFMLGPRINAAGRIGTGLKAVELLTSTDLDKAREVAAEINLLNNSRREFDKSVTEEAVQMIAADPLHVHGRSTVVYSEEWHKGVVGIVASRLIDTWYRPTIVLTHSDGYAVGSARSVKDFDVHEAIAACEDLLEQFGGHRYAAGLKLRVDRLDAFRQRFEQVVASTITPEQLIPSIDIDFVLHLSHLSGKLVSLLKQFAPFGPGNMNPVFASHGLVAIEARTVGTDGRHLKLLVAHPDQPHCSLDCVAWNMAHLAPLVSDQRLFDLAYTIEENEFRGNVTVQLYVKDIRAAFGR
jgi:single-stranded-DNA-specific exonuclease